MKKTLFLLVLVALAVSSCATARYYGGFAPEAARQDMVLMGPVSAIFYLDEDNQEIFSDSLSTVSETMIAGLVNGMGMPISDRIELNDDQKEEAAAYLRYLLAQKPKNRDLFPIPDLLDEVLEAQGSRYGLILFARGMTRDVKGYRKELARDVLVSVATAVLTLGTAVAIVTPNRYSSQIMAAVLDSETDRLVFFNTKNPQETDPLNLGPVHDQLSKLLKDFLK